VAYNLTLDYVIREALRMVGNGSPDPTQRSVATDALNSIVQSWQSAGIIPWMVSNDSRVLSVGVATYELGSQYIDIEPTVYITDTDNKDYTLEKVSRSVYNSISDKLDSGRPSKILFRRTLTTSYIDLWKVPDKAYTLKFNGVQRLDVLSSSGACFQSEWANAMIYALAYRLSHVYGLDIDERKMLREDANNWLVVALNSLQGEAGNLYIAPSM